jgi:predicted small metal-binding protein
MKTLACKDLGADCGFVAKGETADEVVKKMADHAAKAHKDKAGEMSHDQMMEKVKDA